MRKALKASVVLIIVVPVAFFFLAPIRDTGSHFCSPPAGSDVCGSQPKGLFESYESFGCVIGIGVTYVDGQFTIGCSWPAA